MWRLSPGRPGLRGLVSVGKQEEGTEVPEDSLGGPHKRATGDPSQRSPSSDG